MGRPLRFIFVALLIATIIGYGKEAGADSPTSLTVMPFTSLKGESQAWLGKGLADLFIKNLGQVDAFIILERSRMQAFVDEMELSESGLVEKRQAIRMGRVARVEQVLYGNYTLSGSNIEINAFNLDLRSQNILQTYHASGKLEGLRVLVKDIALKLVKERGIKLSKGESEKIRFAATDSIKATEHFYTGIDLYDKGQYADAFGRFFAASKSDPGYLEANFWMARLLEAQGQGKQAFLTYRKLYESAPASVEGQDAMMFAGLIAEHRLKDKGLAIETYRALAKKKPVTPHNLEASFRLGELLGSKGEYQEAWSTLQAVTSFHNDYHNSWWKRLKTRSRNSSFFNWRHVMHLYRDSARQMIGMYRDLIASLPKDRWPTLPEGAYLLDPENPVVGSRRFGITPALFEDIRKESEWTQRFFAVIVPKGYVATGVDMEATGKIFRRGTSGGQSWDDFIMRIHPFPLPRDVFSAWLGVLYGQTLKTTTLRKGITFHGEDRSIFMVQVGAAGGEVSRWKIKAHLRKETMKAEPEASISVKGGGSGEARLLSTVPFPQERFTGSGHQHHFYLPRKELAMVADGGGRVSLVTLLGALDDAESDLWFSQSPDGKSWAVPVRMPINSSSEEYYPRLVVAEDGSLQLFWISKRRGMDWEIWTSRLTKKGKWSHPARIPIEKYAPWKRPSAAPNPKKGLKNTLEVLKDLVGLNKNQALNMGKSIPDILEYAVIQNRRGQWVLAYYSYAIRSMVVLQSPDLQSWKELSRIDTGGSAYGPSLVQDSGGVYRLALFSGNGQTKLYSSNEGSNWSVRGLSLKCDCKSSSNQVHSFQLFPQPRGGLTLLVSDNTYGLQFTRFNPDAGNPELDLVTRALTQPYAATKTPDGKFLVALKKNKGIEVYQYSNFSTNRTNKARFAIYTEQDQDHADNTWNRIFAYRRVITPDVTALAVGPKGRVWWGIESGIMTRTEKTFSVQDVGNGFFL